MSTIKKLFKRNDMHLEQMGTHSNSVAARDYCKKSKDFIEIKKEGFKEELGGRGARNDIVGLLKENENY